MNHRPVLQLAILVTGDSFVKTHAAAVMMMEAAILFLGLASAKQDILGNIASKASH